MAAKDNSTAKNFPQPSLLDIDTPPTPPPPPKTDLNKKEVRQALHGEPSRPNHRGRGRTPAEQREQYAQYRAIKKRAQKFERTNHQYLVLFPASDININKENKFYNMGWNSAIIYCYEIGPRIKRSPALRHDMDNGNHEDKSHSGVCSIASLEKLTEKLATIGIQRIKMANEDELVFFKLSRRYEASEIREMLKSEQQRLNSLNQLLYAKVLYPDVHRQILELKRIIPAKVKNMDRIYREIIGIRIIDSLMELVNTYTQMAHGDIDEKLGAERMLLELDIMLGEISVFNELKLWEVSACSRVGAVIIGLHQLLKGRILNKR